MNRKVAFLIILALIILYCVICNIEIPYRGIISLLVLVAIAVVAAKTFKKEG